MNITYTLMLNDEEQDVDFVIEADITYQPARISGPPEDCYPDESECYITEIKVRYPVDGCSDEQILAALEKQVGEEKIKEDLWSDYMDAGVDDGPA